MTPQDSNQRQNFEKLGLFYLGREHELPLLYDARDLTTHAVCVGMTGSGKTGLCIGLLEEAALDGVPAIAIDPKGDLGNLLLTFPDLAPEDFRPWVDPGEASRQGLTIEAYAESQAKLWRDGLADWGQDGERIRRLRAAADFTIYTPGSSAGRQVSILDSFAAPPAPVRDDPELLGDRIGTTVTSLLSLIGIEGDPIRSREHILLATILESAWKAKRDLTLEGLIQAIQEPPVERIGVLQIEAFYPAGERFELAMALNNLLASPGFESWLSGEPLDIGRMLYDEAGKPRVSIFSIAHLADAERMFFVSLLLNEIVGWTRAQSGTTSLRALVYMDEIFGYFPPVATPPSKAPLLTLLKQARAFGVGIVLATQNPVDLDYKGLSNAGTWWIGRLQTERDKARVLEGLEGAAAEGSQAGFDRGRMDEILSGLGKRVFLMHNVHERAPAIFETRWVMSYLRGPLTRDEIRRLMHDGGGEAGVVAQAPAEAPAAAPAAPDRPAARRAPAPEPGTSRPLVPPGVPEYFLPAPAGLTPGARLHYRPVLLGVGEARCVEEKHDIDHTLPVARTASFPDGAIAIDWDDAAALDLEVAELQQTPGNGASYGSLPAAAVDPKNYDDWRRSFSDWIYGNRSLELLKSALLEEVSRPGESERDFRIRLGQRAREERDRASVKLREKYESKLERLQERVRKAEQAVEREGDQARDAKMQTMISAGATLLGMVFGRRITGRATTAARGVGRTMRQRGDVDRARETLAKAEENLARMEREFEAELENLEERFDPLTETLEKIAVKPRRKDVRIELVALGWLASPG